jgi:DHA1 family bicyclomycin/chloramphenicol resistance-like MFS transporter
VTAAGAAPVLVVPAPPVAVRRLLVLAFVAATSPLAVDLYLASFPDIQRDLGTTPGKVQLTLTAYLVGISIGQPVWGLLSDRFGRRTPLLVAGSMTLVSSAAIVLAPTIELLVAGRFVQALSAAAGMVIARAMISDLAAGYAGVQALSVMMTIHALVPVVGPVAGGVLATFLPWRGVLAVFTAFVAVQLVVSVVLVRETLPPGGRSARLRLGDLGGVLRRPGFLAHALVVGLAVAALMAYVGSAPFVYQGVLGFTPLAFGLAFTLNALGMACGSLLSARLAALLVHPARTAGWALPGAVVSCALVSIAAASPRPVLLVVPVFTHAVFANLVMTSCMGLAMEHARGLPGAGSAVLGMLMFAPSALAAPLPGILGGGAVSAVPMGLVMTAAAVLAAGVLAAGRAWVALHPESELGMAPSPARRANP